MNLGAGHSPPPGYYPPPPGYYSQPSGYYPPPPNHFQPLCYFINPYFPPFQPYFIPTNQFVPPHTTHEPRGPEVPIVDLGHSPLQLSKESQVPEGSSPSVTTPTTTLRSSEPRACSPPRLQTAVKKPSSPLGNALSTTGGVKKRRQWNRNKSLLRLDSNRSIPATRFRKGPTPKASPVTPHNDDIDSELRPVGMCVQCRDEDLASADARAPFITIHVTLGHVTEVALDVFVGSALIEFYTKCENLRDAHMVFEEMTDKTLLFGERSVAVFGLRNPEEIPWGSVGADMVVESTGKVPYVVKLNPDDDKQNVLLAGMSDKKIVQWDMNEGKITQEYDQHLGAVNTLTFVDNNRRFVTSSDDKSLRVWEFGIPVVIKYISEPHMHYMPAIMLHPNSNWLAAQSMDNQILIYSTREKFQLNKKKRFAGHVVAGYACQVGFSPDGRFVFSGDGEGRCWFSLHPSLLGDTCYGLKEGGWYEAIVGVCAMSLTEAAWIHNVKLEDKFLFKGDGM